MKWTNSWQTMVLFVATFAMGTNQAAADTPFFWDDFDRESLFDVPWEWFNDETPEETLTIVDGSLIIEGLTNGNPPPSATVILPLPVEDFSLRTQLHFIDPIQFGRTPHTGFLFVEDAFNPSDWGVVAADGSIYIGHGPGGIRDSMSVFSIDEILEKDIHLQYDVIDGTEFLTSWLDGEDKPDTPQIKMNRVEGPADLVSVFMAPNPDLSGGIAVRYVAMLPTVPGDFSADNFVNADDIDLLSQAVRDGSSNRVFDLDDDRSVGPDDHATMIKELLATWYGDSNLDGEFSSQDFVAVFQAGEYEDAIVGNSTWASGDWNGDGEFDSTDFVVAFQDGGFENGPRDNNATVPEPDSMFGLVIASVYLFRFLNSRQNKKT